MSNVELSLDGKVEAFEHKPVASIKGLQNAQIIYLLNYHRINGPLPVECLCRQ